MTSFAALTSGPKMPWSEHHVNQHPGPECFWWPFADRFGSPNVQWCEETICQVVSQPANTWSNMAYVLFSLIMWIRLWASQGKKLPSGAVVPLPRSVLRVFPWANLVCGLCSLVYHASNIQPFQMLDFFGMFAVTGWTIKSHFLRHDRMTSYSTGAQIKKESLALAIFLQILGMAALTVVCHICYLYKIKFQGIVTLLMFFIIALDLKWCKPLEKKLVPKMSGATSYTYFWASLSFLLIAFAFSMSDLSRVFCDPKDHIIQGHALWHCFSSTGLYCLFEHLLLRSQGAMMRKG